MADWREFGATNKPETCLWCGKGLRWATVSARSMPQTEHFDRAKRGDKALRERRYNAPGDYGDGYFCGLRCAYQFGVLAAQSGKRFQRSARRRRAS